MNKRFKKSFFLSSAVVALALSLTTAFAQGNQNPRQLYVKQSLDIINPDNDITTSNANYYITGSSNPSYPLYMNGYEVTNRGKYGSFGIYVSLSPGKNYVELSQNGVSERVYITRTTGGSSSVSTTKRMTKMFPIYDFGVRTSDKVKISCVAPSGARVYAVVDGVRVELEQVAATAVSGVPANFRGYYYPNSYPQNQTTNLGKVTYYMTYAGVQTSWQSVGNLYAVGDNANFIVEVDDENVMTFATPSATKPYNGVLRKGATDRVVNQTEDLYKLASGGWIRQNAVKPVVGYGDLRAVFSSAELSQTQTRDLYFFSCSKKPSYKFSQNGNTMSFRFYNTSGLSSVPYKNGRFFSYASAVQDGNDLVLSFTIKDNQVVWGYDVSYVDGGVRIIFKEKPFLGSSQKPLSNTVVCIDPGHGGTDSGALGVQGTKGPMEKDITLATAYAVKDKLESLGAYVVMTRTDDSFINLNGRNKFIHENNCDFFVSIHANSIAVTRDGTKTSGVEVYYNQPNSKQLATSLLERMNYYTGREKRNAFNSHYVVTLDPYLPSSLLEMGFMPNPIEYDDMCSPSGMANTAAAVAQSILDCF